MHPPISVSSSHLNKNFSSKNTHRNYAIKALANDILSSGDRVQPSCRK